MNLVVIKNNEPITTSLVVAEGMKIEHRAVIVLLDKYEDDFRELGTFAFEMRKSGGRPIRYAELNEEQMLYLITLMRNSQVVVKFKKELSKEFIRQRRLISHLLTQRKNSEWIEQRQQGIMARKEETDTIKDFVEYCKEQGSQNADRYYSNISKMENKALFMLEQKFPNVRNVLTGYQLSTIASADLIVAKAIKAGMESKMPYKDIYIMAKQRIEQFADLVGKTLVPLPLAKQIDL